MSVVVLFEIDVAGNTSRSRTTFHSEHRIDYVREMVLQEFKAEIAELNTKPKYYELYYNDKRLRGGCAATLADGGVEPGRDVYLYMKMRLMRKVEFASARNYGGSRLPGFSAAAKVTSVASAGAVTGAFNVANLLGANINTRAEGDRLLSDLEKLRVEGRPSLSAVKSAGIFTARVVSISAKGAANLAGTQFKVGGKVIGLV